MVWLKYVFRGGVVVTCLDVGYAQKVASAKVWTFEELPTLAPEPSPVCRRRMLARRPSSRLVALWTTGYLLTRRRNPNRSDILCRPRPLSLPVKIVALEDSSFGCDPSAF